MQIDVHGTVEAWANGNALRAAGEGRFEASASFPHGATVALRIRPEIGMSGAAALPEPIHLDCEPGLTGPGDWSKLGALECYSGGAWYRKTITLTSEEARTAVTLDLGQVVATAEVRVNGQVAGIRVAPPWRVDVAGLVKAGENRIEILVYNTLANHYLTVPTRYRGELTSGLLGPVAFVLTPSLEEHQE